ncbi:DUF6113 family protein [Streptomyces meridianus]|uniref:DUF6113 family protein n=1 Tax=Streptomyces meridianus TaxID=2938945 RepID=A0ABT0X2R2_9ACTN|nr:DUF6113 family protein [Streptomyces meridianus]MCM2576213.1 DUF6113 family protein [Streptomyces meridianus]
MNAARLARCVVLAVLGLLTGAAGALVQAAWFPGGLLLALAAVGALCYGGVKATGGRAGGGCAAGGWLAAVLWLTSARPEGDFVFGAGIGSYVFLLVGMMLAVMCTTLPRPASEGAGKPRPVR